MSILRKGAFLLGLVVIAAADILIYRNIHLYYQAEKTAEVEKRIEILTRAGRIYPLNDLVYYSLGKAYFSLGLRHFHAPQESVADFNKANENFRRSIRLNPTSPFYHFYFAQSLLNLSLLSGSSDSNFYEEYKRAAELSTENSQVYYEVGKACLSLWPRLSGGDRQYVLNMIKQILDGRDRERIISLIRIWPLDVGDYDLLEDLLPQDAEIFRLYADFLGEKGISTERRQKSLSRAEFLEFEKAKADFQNGERSAFYYEWESAERQFDLCLSRLKRIHFYQELVTQKMIDLSEYDHLLGLCHFYLAKGRLESGERFADVETHLREYLRLEGNPSSLHELENYLIDRGLIEERLPQKLDDMRILSFQLLLFYKQNRFSEIMNFGRFLQRSFVVVPEEQKKDYVRVLLILGDTLQKLNYFYEANDFYQKALALDPGDLETLIRIRQNYLNLNNEAKLQETQRKIKDVITSEVRFENVLLEKGETFSQLLMGDGRERILELSLGSEKNPTPVLSILFNDRVVWEKSSEGAAIVLSVPSQAGENILSIVPLNRPVTLKSLIWRDMKEDAFTLRR